MTYELIPDLSRQVVRAFRVRRQDLDDVRQEVACAMVAASAHLDLSRGEAECRGFLARAGYNAAARYLKRAGRRSAVEFLAREAGLGAEAPSSFWAQREGDPEEHLHARGTIEALTRALAAGVARMSPGEKAVFLSDLAGHARPNEGRGTTGNQASRAREKLAAAARAEGIGWMTASDFGRLLAH